MERIRSDAETAFQSPKPFKEGAILVVACLGFQSRRQPQTSTRQARTGEHADLRGTENRRRETQARQSGIDSDRLGDELQFGRENWGASNQLITHIGIGTANGSTSFWVESRAAEFYFVSFLLTYLIVELFDPA